MECDICGKTVSFFSPEKYKVGEFSVCKNCVDEAQRIVNGKEASESAGEKTVQQSTHAGSTKEKNFKNLNVSKFRTLQSFGSVYSGIGWFVVIIGIVGVIVGLLQEQRLEIVIFVGSLLLILSGLGFIITGQIVKCFVAIENNTRGVYNLLADKLPTIE